MSMLALIMSADDDLGTVLVLIFTPSHVQVVAVESYPLEIGHPFKKNVVTSLADVLCFYQILKMLSLAVAMQLEWPIGLVAK